MANNKSNTIFLDLSDKLDKGGYNGTASTLKADIDSKFSKVCEIYGIGTRPLNDDNYTLNNLSITEITDNLFSISGGIVTYLGPTNPKVKISFNASADQTTNGTRSTSKHAIFVNGIIVQKTERYAYHRVNNDGKSSASFSGYISLNTNDTIELRSAELTSTDEVTMLLGQTNLLIENVI